MTVEFVGAPAVGKSYLHGHLARLTGVDAHDREVAPVDEQPRAVVQRRKVRDAVFFTVRHPRTTASLTGVVRRSRQKQAREGVTKLVNLLAELHRAGSGSDLRISEQGVLQAIWSLGLRASKSPTQTLLQHCRPWLPHTALLVTVDRDEVARRLGDRDAGRSRLDGAPAHVVDLELARGDQLMEQLLTLWEGLDADHRVIELTNARNADPMESLGSELELIKQRMASKEQQ